MTTILTFLIGCTFGAFLTSLHYVEILRKAHTELLILKLELIRLLRSKAPPGPTPVPVSPGNNPTESSAPD